MIICEFLGTVEFYVICALVAAAVLGLCVKPASKGEVRTFLYPGILAAESDPHEEELELTCLDDGSIEICRHGLSGKIAPDGAYSIAVKLSGFDVEITERITRGHGEMSADSPGKATVMTDFAGREYYHFRYKNEETGQLVVFTLHNRPGIHVIKKFTH